MMMMMRWWLLLLVFLTMPSRSVSQLIELENCTYAIEFYKDYLNLLWSSIDARSLRIQAVYSLSSNQSSHFGHISTVSSRSVALIPFFVRCQSNINRTYLPFTQCSSTRIKKFSKTNYESTRTNLDLRTIQSLTNVPLLYLGEYSLILSNCSFQLNSIIYRLKSTENFSFDIQYESPWELNCTSCNRRTSICSNRTCQCRSGARAFLFSHKQQKFCVDTTKYCILDPSRCLQMKSFKSDQFIFILIILICFVLSFVLGFLWFLYRLLQTNELNEKHERTSSTLSTTDSISTEQQPQYPKVVHEENNCDIVYILV